MRSRLVYCVTFLILGGGLLWGQTNSTGAVSGTVEDPTGAAVPHATVKLDQNATNVHLTGTTDASGNFSFSNLQPGDYEVTATASGFNSQQQAAVVQVGKVTTASFKLPVGANVQTVEVSGTAATAQVDTQTATVSGVINTNQIQQLPQIQRNYLDLAQLEPGVQMVDGGNFDPTKNGFAGLSVEGAEGRTTDINVDGIDITDQTVGTTLQNISDLSIEEFQVSQSSGDTSSDIGNTGQVNIVTKSGTNTLHGNGFAYYRSKRFAADPVLGGPAPPFKQNQDGLSFGGPMIKNRLFWFVAGERSYRDAYSGVNMPDFPNYTGNFPTPGYEDMGNARLDYAMTPNLHMFYSFAADSLKLVPPSVIGGTVLSPFTNQNVTNTHTAAVDWNRGRFTNSFRYGHIDFFNHISATAPAGLPTFPVGITFVDTGEQFGPNLLAPQHTYQINNELRYEGSFYWGNHTLRYGAEYNHIVVDLYAAFFSQAPVVYTYYNSGVAAPGLSPTNPLSYSPESYGVFFGNGLGYFSNLPAIGNPYGGVYNPRKSAYITDSWRITHRLTLDYGVHWERDPGEVNSDLPIPAQIQAFNPTLYGHHPAVPNNFSPNFGFAWDPTGHGTTSIRGGIGMYYENDIFNNVMFERSNYISNSLGPAFPLVGSAGTPTLSLGNQCFWNCNGTQVTEPLSVSAPSIVAAQAAYQAAVAALPQSPLANPAILGSGATPGTQNTGNPIFDANYRTPYSVQANLGFQHQLAHGTVLSVDYVQNRGFDLLMPIDQNYVGDASFFNAAAAASAIAATATDLHVPQGANPGATMTNLVNAIHAGTVTQSAVQGELLGGNTAGASIGSGINEPSQGISYAFGGANPAYGNMTTDENAGDSNYRGLQVKLTARANRVTHWLRADSLTVSYSLSRLDSTQFDQSFAQTGENDLFDQVNPRAFYGPNGYDRTNQLNLGGIFNAPGGLVFSTVNHFASGFALTPRLGVVGLGSGEIFATDVTGDGTTGDVIPGTNVGRFNRTIKNPQQLQAFLTNYNMTEAGKPTPAGNVLIGNGMATAAQLQALGLVMPLLSNVTPTQVMPGGFYDTDLRISRPVTFEHFSITPMVEVFNLFNVGNYDPPGDVMSGDVASTQYAPGTSLSSLGFGTPGSITNTPANNNVRKYGLNTGVFAEGIPRAFQFGIRFAF